MYRLLFVLAMFGCGPKDKDGDGLVPPYDCNDVSAAVYTGAPEICDGLDNNCDGRIDEDPTDGTTFYLDLDGDGHGGVVPVVACGQTPPAGAAAASDDCDDVDPTTWPGAPELCDGEDNDCNGKIDDNPTDPTTFFADKDEDGFGDPKKPVKACVPPPGYVANNRDCDDTTAVAHPGGVEICDGKDDDCDGKVDNGAVDAATWYADTDGDGFGDDATTAKACTAPAGYVAAAGDCDDTVKSVHPGAAESCNVVDDDCDDNVDENATDAITWYEDADGDGYGNAAISIRSCSKPAGYAKKSDDCDDLDAKVNPGATEICKNHLDDNCDGNTADCAWTGAMFVTYGDAHLASTVLNDQVDDGYHALLALDADDNGRADIVFAGMKGPRVGIFRSVSATMDAAAADTIIDLSATASGALLTLSDVGDVDGNGFDDLAIGAVNAGDGVVYVFTTPIPLGKLTAADAYTTLRGTSTGELFGYDVAGGDLNADGNVDLVVTSLGGNGAAWVFEGPLPLSAKDTSADARIVGTAAQPAGAAATIGPDLDGDGYPELLVGSVSDGHVHIFRGPLAAGSHATTSDDIRLSSSASDDFGSWLWKLDDLNGDGVPEFAVGAPKASTDIGAVYFYGAGVADGDGPADAEGSFTGFNTGDLVGTESPFVDCDLNGDGAKDLVMFAPWMYGLAANDGIVLVVYATTAATSPELAIYGTGSDNFAGASGACADLDGDGYDDLLIGTPFESTSATNAGGAWIVYGSGP